ncbi:unnamed protein product [Candida verbasci]|uniref:WKF domain-containing protein n=1 Tax=Candida verbasci TaxID=1227364 RepID=A0A9W4TU20_9ASCO|nr:unnamed protein product [Candida verbasci]
MSSIPAWKKLGLSVNTNTQEEEEQDSFQRIENGDLTNKQIKKLSNKKRKLQDDINKKDKDKEKKPPKRQKLPKNERKPPPIPDQLTYLKQFETDKSNWKFNKSKQNWILKNIKIIPKDYESALVLYMESIQGGSRDRIVTDLKEVIKKWNEKYEEAEKKIEQELEKKEDDQQQEENIEEKKEEDKKEDNKDNKDNIDLDYASRCQLILESMIGEDDIIEVKGK